MVLRSALFVLLECESKKLRPRLVEVGVAPVIKTLSSQR